MWTATIKSVFPYPKIAVDYSNEEFKACIWVKTTDTDMWNTNNPQFIVSHNHKIIRSLDMNHNYFLLPQQSSKEIYLNVYTTLISQTFYGSLVWLSQ